jgi:hypothetical protein
MDTSFWKSINSDIRFKETKKQFWGRYLWRMELNVNCAHIACDNDPEHAVELLKYQMINRSNYGGSWRNPYWHGYTGKYENVDFDLLRSIKTVKLSFSSTVKTRIEDSSVQFYTETEDDLKLITKLLTNYECVQIITGPRKGTEQLLSSDVIIAPKTPFKYKVLLRDGNYGSQLKAQVLNLLESQEDIKITAGLRHNLKRPYPGMWGAFFYANDLGITTMLSLMSPGIIGKIHEVVQA